MITRILSTIALGAALSLAACAPKPEPELASSASQPDYAERYSADLQATATGFGERRAEAKRAYGNFGGYPDQLKDPNYALVLDIVTRADEAGRSRAFVERIRRVNEAAAFFDAEKDEINRKVAGTVQFVAKKQGCSGDVGSSASGALKDAVEKQLDDHMHHGNDAWLLLDRRRAELGKENAAALEKQVDEISRASYIVNVELVERKQAVQRMIDEADRVKQTADAYIAAERKYQGQAKLTPAEKKSSDEHIEAMQKSVAGMNAAVTQARNAVARFDEDIENTRREYTAAFDKLRTTLEQKAKAAPAR